MTNRHWRELVEIVGVVGIVAAMILVASELRESNRIAVAQAQIQTRMQINERQDKLNLARAADPDIAKLYAKMEAPEAHLITATEASQIRGIALHAFENMWSVHTAFENRMISRETRDAYIVDFARTMDALPGIRPHYVEIYDSLGASQDADVYKPISDYIATQSEAKTP